jgi:hypothetical protein
MKARRSVSPDERAIATLIVAATRRARALLAAESVAWAAIAAAAAFELTRNARWTAGARLAIVIVAEVTAALVAGVRRRRTAERIAIVRALERSDPAGRNLIVTADEIAAGSLATTAATRARVFADAAAVAARVDLRRILPRRRALAAAVAAMAAWTAVAAAPRWRAAVARVAPGFARGVRAGATGDATLHVRIVVQPPAYTSLEPTTAIDPEEVRAVEGSEIAIAPVASATAMTVEHDGAQQTAVRAGDGSLSIRVRVTQTGYLLVAGGGGQRLIPIVVVPDALPSVRLAAPGRDLVYAGGEARVAFEARATDDFGLRSLALRFTKVSGSGENFEFMDGEIPLDLTRASRRDWTGRASRSLAELGLHDGDMLVYRAVAADARPGDGSGSSDAFFIEISKLGAAAGDAFTLPDEETRYALSQQMLIVKTERLHRRRAALAAAAVSEQALDLAVEQRMIRAELVFMLGGEVEDEDVEAQQSTELQEGRLRNRGQRDLRAATVAMSQAEKFLGGANTADALVAERAAVTALQRAFARDRYILRALGTRSQLDLSRRLTGSTGGAADWRRALTPAPENRRAARLDDLLRGLAALAPAAPATRTEAAVLAAEAIRIDPASASLRAVAAALQRLQTAGDGAAAAAALSEASAAALAESRRSDANPAFDASRPAPVLAGAFGDALKARR